jgi:hypothetical protein
MTVEQSKVVDFVSVDHLGNAVLTISDHLPWDDVDKHVFQLREKVNAYLRFVESKEIYEKNPAAANKPIIFDIVLKHLAPTEAEWFFIKCRKALAAAGFSLRIREIDEENSK